MTQKLDFYHHCLKYFDSFGWDISSEQIPNSFTVSRSNLDEANRPFKENYSVLIINAPNELYPENWRELSIKENIIIVAPEFAKDAPIRSSKKHKVIQHVASGIHFTYITKK